MFRIASISIVAGFLAIGAGVAHAQPLTVERHVYVHMNFDAPLHDQAAHLYHESRNALAPLGQVTGKTNTFTLQELVNVGPIDDVVWFRGVSDVQVMHGTTPPHAQIPGNNVSADPAYRRLNHHMVIGATGRPARDPCNRVWPVSASQEMTTYDFRDIPGVEQYGMRFDRADTMSGANWHWHNPAGIQLRGQEAVYLRFTLVFVINGTAQDFTDVHVSWASINYCGHEVCIPSGTNTIYTGDWQVPRGVSGRIVAAMPHVHDHSTRLAMWINTDRVFRIEPFTDAEFTNHHCAGMPFTGWHAHPGHLTWGGVQHGVEMPGANGPTFKTGDIITVALTVDVPEHTLPNGDLLPIDGMGIWKIFWKQEN